MQKRFLYWTLSMVILLSQLMLGSPPTVVAQPNSGNATNAQISSAPSISAGAAILMDYQTGQVLYEKAAKQRKDPASTTKVLTAVVALQRASLTDQVKISQRAANTPGSSMYIRAGEVYSLHDLLHGLLLRSGNDAAAAIAEHVAGSVESFAAIMNSTARELGAINSRFVNPHGLTDPLHFSTAYDLALITRHALQNPTFRAIVALRDRSLTFEHLRRDVVMHNTNRLLSKLEGADGVKTGTTAAAGACLIASATREEHKLVAVVLHAGNRWSDSARLLEWGFSNYRLDILGRKGEIQFAQSVQSGKSRKVPVALGADLTLLRARTSTKPLPVEVEFSQRLVAPLRAGQELGRIRVRESGKLLAEVPLIAAADVPKATILEQLYQGLVPLLDWVVDTALL